MDSSKVKDRSFYGVALAFILAGAFLFAVGVVVWILNLSTNSEIITSPTLKAIGGMVIIGIGYIILILECIRKK